MPVVLMLLDCLLLVALGRIAALAVRAWLRRNEPSPPRRQGKPFTARQGASRAAQTLEMEQNEPRSSWSHRARPDR